MSNTDPTEKPEVNSGAREGKAVFCFDISCKEAKSIPVTHIYLTAHFPVLVQALQ